MNRDDEWTSEELKRVTHIYEDREPAADLEDRLVKRLRREGVLDRERTEGSPGRGTPDGAGGWRHPLLGTAATILIFATGVAVGTLGIGSDDPGASDAPFVLLLHASPDAPPMDSPEELRLVESYGRWMGETERETGPVDGLRLTDRSEMIAPEGDAAAGPERGVVGFFTVNAADWETARRIAETHPHRATGGWVQLRRVAPVDRP